jgi:hypothetical protein
MGHHREFEQCGRGVERQSNRAIAANASAYRGAHTLAATFGHLLLDREEFQIRLATDSWRPKSDVLVERMYTWRGYKPGHLENSPGKTPHSVTLQACSGEDVFGTLNVGIDSHAGLASDGLYRSEIDEYRESGRVVAEFTRLAIDPEYGSKDLLGTIFHLAYLCATELGHATDLFVEVNPRHVGFYKHMLNFAPAGECKICPRVDAPAVLLHLEVTYVLQQVARCAGHRGGGRRSLYPYFCPPREEAAALRRIAALRSDKGLIGSRPSAQTSMGPLLPTEKPAHPAGSASAS